ncbi:hypothetical protein GGI07_003255 [Coemansia sp. Benny D115]|nr:hypothetical protein GGI07_003255 [Coemansia sp. Benny D115]
MITYTNVANRTSFRLTLSIALACIAHSICKILTHFDTFMTRQTEISLRMLYWFTIASGLFTLLLIASIGTHLLLTLVIGSKLKLLMAFKGLYEVASLFLSLVLSHAVLYLFDSFTWDVDMHTYLFDGKLPLRKSVMWGVYLSWCLVCLVYCVGVFGYVNLKINRVGNMNASSGSLHIPIAPEGVNGISNWETLTARYSNKSQFQQEEMRSTAFRISLYCILPLVAEIWPVLCALVPHDSVWLYGMANVMPSSYGIACLALLLASPALDEPRMQIIKGVRRRLGLKSNASELRLDFAKLDASTIHLSPYQSREASISTNRPTL